MRKILLILVAFIMLQTTCFAQEGISFLYINGSNNNDAKMKKWYENGVKKLHPYMKKEFETNPKTFHLFLKNGDYHINSNPIIFFWGDKSHKDLSFVEQNLAISKGFSSWFAFQIRSMITKFLHDAIWVQKYHNMDPILDELHASIQSEASAGNKVVLYGYSAGSFVTYQYLLSRMTYLNVAEFLKSVKAPDDLLKFANQNPVKDTCLEAIGQDIAVLSVSGHVVLNKNIDILKSGYLELDKVTDTVCAPKNSIKGIVNFASPLVLFYSDLSDPSYDLTYYNRLLFKYIIENDMFWLTVNYRTDPLGFPGGRNLTFEEIEDATHIDINPNKGFIYDHSNTKSSAGALRAHTSYWATGRRFSKAVVDAYIQGYAHHYDDNFSQTKVKRFQQKLNITP